MGPGIRIDAGSKVGDLPAAPGREAEEAADDGPSEEQSQSDSSVTSEGTAEEPATA